MDASLVAGAVAGSIAGGIVAAMVALRRSAARFATTGAIAESQSDARGSFALDLPAGGVVDVFVRYTLHGTRMSGGGFRYGAALLVTIEREGVGSVLRNEYLIGSAHRPIGEAPVTQSLAAGPVMRSGLSVSRGLLLARVPAGGRVTVRGRIQPLDTTECRDFVVFAKAPR